jgi:hypothetical protein
MSHRATLDWVVKRVTEGSASKWRTDKRKEKIFKDSDEKIFHHAVYAPHIHSIYILLNTWVYVKVTMDSS